MSGKRYNFYEDTYTTVREQLKYEQDGTIYAKDISSANLKAYFRVIERGKPGTSLLNQLMTKVVGTSVAGDTGIVTTDVTIPSGYRYITCRVVLVDQTTSNALTLSGYKEFVWDQFDGMVDESPQPS